MSGFVYNDTKYRYRVYFRNGKWEKGYLTEDANITIHESSNVFHYGQGCFEGLKAFRTKDNSIQMFRPKMNWERMNNSLERLVMPTIPYETFMEAIEETIKANIDSIPKYGTGESLYIRPFVIGVGKNLGVKPAEEYIFSVFVSPVGAYFDGGLKGVDFVTTAYDRAAPNGTGHVKVAGNYAASLYPRKFAKEEGFAEVVYLDPATHTKIEEIGAANFFAITKDNTFVTPTSNSILPSITKLSLIDVCKNYLDINVEQRDCYINNLDEFSEAGACGTAAVISPIASITHEGKKHVFNNGEVGEITKKLYDTLLGIQLGELEDKLNWNYKIKL